MNREETLKLIVDYYNGFERTLFIKPYEKGNYMIGVTYFFADGGDMVPVETGRGTIHCQCVGAIAMRTPVMLVRRSY